MAKYIVSTKKIKKNVNKLKQAFKKQNLDFQLFYSVKTNFTKPVLKTVKETNSNYEILSRFEWEKVKDYYPKAVVLNGPGKSVDLVKDILKNVDELYFNIDNDSDIEILGEVLQGQEEKDNKIKVGLRVYLNKKGIWTRFGYEVTSDNLREKIRKIKEITALDGIHFHFSTNDFRLENYEELFLKLRSVLKSEEVSISYLDIGGGLPGANEFVYESQVYEELPILIKKNFPNAYIISEAGRNVVADAMHIKANVISLKRISKDSYQVNIDTNIMHAQCLFQKKHNVEYESKKGDKTSPVEIRIFGDSCMQIDKISDEILIPNVPQKGDVVFIRNIGAYSHSQAANFISEIPEVEIYE